MSATPERDPGSHDPRSQDHQDDQGRVAIVTGASRGIGLAAAEALVRRGWRVAITGRDAQSLQEAIDRLGADHAIGIAGKAHDATHRHDLVRATYDAYGRLDALVSNVGTNPVFGPLAEIDLDAARKILDINVVATLGLVQEALKAGFGSEPGAAIVTVASLAGVAPSPGIGFYGVSKAALINLTQQLALELAPRVRVNAVAPAVVKTRFAQALYAAGEEQAARAYPLGRLGEPEDIGAAIAYLASADSAWVTGQTLVIDGGITLTAGLG